MKERICTGVVAKKALDERERERRRKQMRKVRALTPVAPNVRLIGRLRLPQEQIDQTVNAIAQAAPHLSQARYAHALGLLARVLARISILDQIYTEHPRGWFVKMTASGRMQVGLGERAYAGWIERARHLLNDLGLTPIAAKELGLPVESPDEKNLQDFLKHAAADDGDGMKRR